MKIEYAILLSVHLAASRSMAKPPVAQEVFDEAFVSIPVWKDYYEDQLNRLTHEQCLDRLRLLLIRYAN